VSSNVTDSKERRRVKVPYTMDFRGGFTAGKPYKTVIMPSGEKVEMTVQEIQEKNIGTESTCSGKN
jgi:hypothetical protein